MSANHEEVQDKRNICGLNLTVPLHLLKRPESVNVVFSVQGVEAAALCEALHVRGLAMVGCASVEGVNAIRLVCVNADTTEEGIDEFLCDVRRTAAEMRGEP